jgi:hypothetical protein
MIRVHLDLANGCRPLSEISRELRLSLDVVFLPPSLTS